MSDRLLIVEDDAGLRTALISFLEGNGLAADGAASAAEALQRVAGCRYRLIILDLTLPDMSGMELLRRLHGDYPRRVIVFSGTGTVVGAVEAMKLGVFDFIEKPAQPEQLLLTIRNALDLARLSGEIAELRSGLAEGCRLEEIVHRSRWMAEVIGRARAAAASDVTVLLGGETGTGKDLLSRAIHQASPRRGRPYVAVNCAAIPHHLAESELFGHARGAFTDAHQAYAGRFQQADGGTLFLDEIAELPRDVQAKLLRFLEDRVIVPLGSDRSRRLDLRIIAASNRPLGPLAAGGEFRADLLHRLRQLAIDIPPLRERPDDVPPLTEHFIRQGNLLHARRVRGCQRRALAALTRHSWPGNVRELKHLVQEFFVVSAADEIDWPFVRSRLRVAPAIVPAPGRTLRLAAREREHIERVFAECGRDPQRAAQLLGISRATLYRRLAAYRAGRSGPRRKSK